MALCRNVRSQYTQAYGFSLAWIRRCWVRWLCWRNLLPHSGHPYGLLSVCILSCCNRVDFCLKSFPHVKHLNSLSSPLSPLFFFRPACCCWMTSGNDAVLKSCMFVYWSSWPLPSGPMLVSITPGCLRYCNAEKLPAPSMWGGTGGGAAGGGALAYCW